MKKHLLLLTLFLLLFTALFSFPVQAANATYCIDDGSITMGEAEDEVNIYVEQNGKKTVMAPNSVITLVGKSVTTNTVMIQNNITVTLILHNVNIQSADFLKAPICIDNGETVTINLIGENSLVGSDFMAGLQTSGRANVKIGGSGSLTAKGGVDAAGIGGGWRRSTPGSDAGTLTIGGNVKIHATGGENGAGIGGGSQGSLKSLTVSGNAQITAVGGAGAAGIGSGNGGSAKLIRLETGGSILATGGKGGAGIGSGLGGEITTLSAEGSGFLRAYGGEGAAAIGSGKNGTLGTLELKGESSLRVQGGKNAAAIGLGEASTGNRVSLAGKINLFALSENGPGVGGGKNSILTQLSLDESCAVNAFGGAGAAAIGTGENGKLDELTLGGSSKVLAVGGTEAAGIGGGKNSSPAQITLTGRADVKALGGLGGAGVGSGFGTPYSGITVSSSATVYAQGGNYGAGIGSGGRTTAETTVSTYQILITDQSKVTAYGGKYASGIGGGVFGAGSILEINQNAKVTSECEIEIALTLPNPPTGTASVPADVGSVAATSTQRFELSSFTFDSVDPGLASPIYYSPKMADFASASKSFQIGTLASKPAGNGAGCSVAGSTHISGGASLNGMFGDVTLTLSMGQGGTDMVITLGKNESYTLPESVAKPGYTFRGWYRDIELKKPVSGKVTVKEDTTIYAGWNAVQVELEEGELPRAFRDVPYSYQFVTAAGSEGTKFSLLSGELPQGLSLKESGELNGTPALEGRYSFTIQYTNSNGTSGTKEVTLGVYGNNRYTFYITTGDSNGSGSKAQVMMSFTFTDRFTGEEATTQTVNLTSLLLDLYTDPLQRGATVELPLVFEPNVGIPTAFTFTCEDEDGWQCESVQVKFEGNEMVEAFDTTLTLNRWVGTQDDSSFWSIVLTVVIVLLSLVIVLGVTFILLTRNKKFRDFLKQKGFLQGKKKEQKKA